MTSILARLSGGMDARPIRFFIVSADGEEWLYGEQEMYKVRALAEQHRPAAPDRLLYYTMGDDLELRRVVAVAHLRAVPNLVCFPESASRDFLDNCKYALVAWYLGF